MSTRTAIPVLAGAAGLACLSAAPELAIGVVAIDIAVAAAGKAEPDWIKIAPRGDFRCRDGRTYSLDPDAVIARCAADGTHVPIDIGHGTVKDDTTPAIGWIEELQARPDGLYGRTDWLAGGKTVLAARTHRYVSPAFHHDAQNRVTWLHSVALVAAPALANMPALASASQAASADLTHQEPSMKGIATAVGLQESASEAAILSAIAAGFVKKAVHDETLAQLSAATTKLAAIEKANHEGEVKRELEDALKAKKIAPAQREHLAGLSATADGFAGVKAMLASIAPNSVAGAVLEGRQVEKGAEAPKTGATLAAEANKYAKEHGVSFTDAVAILSADPATKAA